MRPSILALTLALLAPACGGGQANQTTDAPPAQTKAEVETHTELNWKVVKAAQESGAVLVDARGAASFAKGHIPGAISVPLGDEATMTRLPGDKSTKLIYYCGGPSCAASTRAAAKATKAGYTEGADFRGGFPAWKARYGLDGSADRPTSEGITVLTWPEVEAAVAGGAVLVDSRSAKGFGNGHITGAINVPYKNDDAHSALPTDKSAEVVFYCSGPICSASTKGAEKALTLGYTNVKEYRGGYPDWASRQ